MPAFTLKATYENLNKTFFDFLVSAEQLNINQNKNKIKDTWGGCFK